MMNRNQMRLAIGAAVTGFALAACGGGSHAPIPSAPGGGVKGGGGTASVAFRIVVPTKTANSTHAVPQFVSPSTVSATVSVSPAPGGTDPAAVTVACTTTCSGTIAAPVGADTFTFKLYDATGGTGGTGKLLSSGAQSATIVAGNANAVNVTFNPVVANVALSLSGSCAPPGTTA
ncbi:MAG: hypothetical protein ACREM8_03390, partial [Vulcanimicrobiaceae bacterium]